MRRTDRNNSEFTTQDQLVTTAIAVGLSFLFAGAGQAYNRQWLKTLIFPVLAFVLWFFLLGWVVHTWALVDAGVVRWLRTSDDSDICVDGLRATGIKVVLFVVATLVLYGAMALVMDL